MWPRACSRRGPDGPLPARIPTAWLAAVAALLAAGALLRDGRILLPLLAGYGIGVAARGCRSPGVNSPVATRRGSAAIGPARLRDRVQPFGGAHCRGCRGDGCRGRVRRQPVRRGGAHRGVIGIALVFSHC